MRNNLNIINIYEQMLPQYRKGESSLPIAGIVNAMSYTAASSASASPRTTGGFTSWHFILGMGIWNGHPESLTTWNGC